MASPLSRAQVEHIAELARLALTEAEKELFTRQLAQILAYAQQIQRLDTREVPPTTHVLTEQTPVRPDEVRPGLAREEALANAPDPAPEAGLFRVPKVIG